MSIGKAMFLWAAVLALGDAAPDEKLKTLEAVREEILEKWNKIESVSADLSVSGFLETDAGGNRTSGGGKFAAMRIGGENRFRSDLALVIKGDMWGGGELPMDSTELLVYDGKEVNILKSMTVLGQRNVMAYKRPLDRKPTMDLFPIFDARRIFKVLNEYGEMKLVQTSPKDLPPVHAIELTFPEGVEMAKMIAYFDKETGVVLRTYAEGRKVEWWRQVDYGRVKTNEENEDMNPNRFVFRLPKGVTFMNTGVP